MGPMGPVDFGKEADGYTIEKAYVLIRNFPDLAESGILFIYTRPARCAIICLRAIVGNTHEGLPIRCTRHLPRRVSAAGLQ